MRGNITTISKLRNVRSEKERKLLGVIGLSREEVFEHENKNLLVENEIRLN